MSSVGVNTFKDFCVGFLYEDQLVACLFVSDFYDYDFSFDIGVLKEHRRKGLASVLVDVAIEYYKRVKDLKKDDTYTCCVEVVNPIMQTLLKKKNFKVHEVISTSEEKTFMTLG
jgi:GNAT superfamily N-acetyltransferase